MGQYNASTYLASVIMPVYNAEKYIEKSIDSIINQTFDDWELIVVDDGSTDTSGMICDRLGNMDDRIKVFHTKNNGQVRATFYGIEKSKGKNIFFVDADDWIESDMLQDMVSKLEDNRMDIVCTGRIDYDIEGNIRRKVYDNIEEGNYSTQNELEYIHSNLFLSKNDSVHNIGGVLASKAVKGFSADLVKIVVEDLKAEHGIERIKMYEDLLFCYTCMLRAKAIAVIHKAYYNYRYNEKSVSKSDNKLFLSNMEAFNDVVKKQINIYGKNIMLEQWNKLFTYFLISGLNRFKGINSLPRYGCAFVRELDKKRVVIFGAGQVGYDFYNEFLESNVEVVLWTDNSEKKRRELNLASVEDVLKCDYDYIVCAVIDKGAASSIKKQLTNMGVNNDIVLWSEPLDKWYETLIKDKKIESVCGGETVRKPNMI